MLVLGIETSGLDGSVALLQNDVCLVEQSLNHTGRRHAQSLVLEIGELLKACDFSVRDVGIVAVSRGPGSFTGLRVGMVCAKTFAYATRCQFIAVDTFAAIAENAPADLTRIFVVEDAQRDDLFVGEYFRDDSNHWQQVSPIRIVSISDFRRDRTTSDYVIGLAVRKIVSSIDSTNLISDPMLSRPRASVIASIGYRHLITDGHFDSSIDRDFWTASPFYLRQSAAEEKRLAMESSNPSADLKS